MNTHIGEAFALGRILATPGAIKALERSAQDPRELLRRHASGDWGEVCAQDKEANELALRAGRRLLSSYRTTSGTKIWIITEADRTSTTILLPEEY